MKLNRLGTLAICVALAACWNDEPALDQTTGADAAASEPGSVVTPPPPPGASQPPVVTVPRPPPPASQPPVVINPPAPPASQPPVVVTPPPPPASGVVLAPNVQNALSALYTNPCAAVADDFISLRPKEYTRLLPRPCKVVSDNPVNFSWPEMPDRQTGTPWTLRVFNQGAQPVATLSVNATKTVLNQILSAGRYTWTVSYLSQSSGTQTSSPRSFQISTDTRQLVIPSATALLTHLSTRPHPRLLPQDTDFASIKQRIQTSDYATPFSFLLPTARAMLNAPINANPIKPTFKDKAERDKWLLDMLSLTNEEMRRIETLSFAWRFSQDPAMLSAAKARLMSLANWDPSGGSSEANQPQANRAIYTSLAIGYDLLGSELSSSERATLIVAFNTRITQAIASVQQLMSDPYDTFKNTGIQFTTQALILMAGTPGYDAAKDHLNVIWPLFLTQFQVYGEEDGGYDGSIAYAWSDMHVASRTLAMLALSTGVDISNRSYIHKMGDFLIAMTTPTVDQLGAFGDGQDLNYHYKNYSFNAYRMYAAVTRQPQHAWYWQENKANIAYPGYISPLHYMLYARQLPTVTPAAPTTQDYVFDDVGMVAMHNNVASPQRSSVMFRSSRFGTYAHAHPDQNSFVFNSHGVNLLINSGYYDRYLSAHHAQVARTTRYKNAVTFDGGLGQAEPDLSATQPGPAMSSMSTRGRLVNALLSDPVSLVTGDATLAYQGYDTTAKIFKPQLSGAYRTVAYFKQAGVVVIYDWLASDKPRRWEWNYHGIQPFSIDDKTLVAHNQKVQACIKHHGVAGTLSTNNVFIVPTGNAAMPEQAHARYSATNPSTQTTMVTVIREDCANTVVNVNLNQERADVSVGDHAVYMERDKASITK